MRSKTAAIAAMALASCLSLTAFPAANAAAAAASADSNKPSADEDVAEVVIARAMRGLSNFAFLF